MTSIFEELERKDAMLASIAMETHFWGALIGGAISLFGGIAGRKDAKKRDAAAAEAAKVPVVTSHKLHLGSLVQDAIKWGFNPMSILNAGGLSAYTVTSTTGQNAMAAVPTAPSMGSVFANAASTAFDIYRDDQKTAMAARAYFPPPPVTGGGLASGGVVRSGAFTQGASFASAARSAPNPYGYEQKAASQTNAMPYFGAPDPKYPDAEAIETTYGEVIAWVYGAGKLYNDAVGWITGTTAASRARAIDSGISKASSLAKDAVDYVDKWLDGQASGQQAKPAAVTDQFNDPFPAWQW